MGSKRKIKAVDLHGVDLEALFYAFEKYNQSKGLSKATMTSYYDSFLKFSKFLGGQSVVPVPTVETIQDYIKSMQDDGIQPDSINHYLRDTRVFLYYGMSEGEIPAFKIRQVKAPEKPPKPYRVEQLKTLLKEPAKGESFVTWRTWAIIYWILDTGNRAETVCNIKMQDIDGIKVTLTHTKNKKMQMIDLGASLMPILNKYIRRFRSDALPGDYLFPNISNEKLTVNALQESIVDYNRKRGIEKTGVHDFRKTYTTMALASGMTTEQEVADRLGHGNTRLLKKYAGFTADQKRAFHDASSPLNQLVATGAKRIIKGRD